MTRALRTHLVWAVPLALLACVPAAFAAEPAAVERRGWPVPIIDFRRDPEGSAGRPPFDFALAKRMGGRYPSCGNRRGCGAPTRLRCGL